jgi:hypothetical protein
VAWLRVAAARGHEAARLKLDEAQQLMDGSAPTKKGRKAAASKAPKAPKAPKAKAQTPKVKPEPQ